ncbi:MAG: hypothetical protein ACRDOM_10435 [Nocardioides sp.]
MTDGEESGATVLQRLPSVTRLITEVVAPTTLVTGLLFFFGWGHAYWFFHYFGVDSASLNLSRSDYVMRSVDGLFVPLAGLAVLGLAVAWGRLLGERILPTSVRRPLGQWAPPAAAVLGVLLVLNGISALFVATIFNHGLAVAPLSFAIGIGILFYLLHRSGTAGPGWLTVTEWLAVFVLVGLTLFWAAFDYSAAVGRSRAAQFVDELTESPQTIVYSESRLNLDAPGINEVRCAGDPELAYGFRYDGLTLLWQTGDEIVLLPRSWTRRDGVAVVIPRDAGVRLEYRRGDATTPVSASC